MVRQGLPDQSAAGLYAAPALRVLAIFQSASRIRSAPAPAGTVTFSDGDAVMGIVPLVNGVATFTTVALGSGVHDLTATYNASQAFTAAKATKLTTPPVVVVAQKKGTVIPLLVLRNSSKTVAGGRTAACTTAKNKNGHVEKGCDVVSSMWLAGAKVTYTLTYADGSKQTFTGKADKHGNAQHVFNVAYRPKAVKKGVARSTATITARAVLPNGTSAGSTTMHFTVQR
jgi:hypothetical protein